MNPAKVLIVDDSAVMRQLLSEILSRDPEINVVGTAQNPYDAWEKIKKYEPDVLTLDVEMPRMDGLTFLHKLMIAKPLPVIMISSLTERGCDTTWKALEIGALDFVTKPKIDVTTGTTQKAEEIIEKVKQASQTRVARKLSTAEKQTGLPTKSPSFHSIATFKTTEKVIAIGASTGGTEALYDVLTALPADSPGVVAVIHMPEGFTKSYAGRLDRACQVRVAEATDGARILPGHVLIAPGGFHTTVVRDGANFVTRVKFDNPVNRHRPSVDVLFDSCAKWLGPNAIGAILTGMGNDGAKGLTAMREAGANTIAQNEATCVVFGMPREAIAMGGAKEVLPLDKIAGRLVSLAKQAK